MLFLSNIKNEIYPFKLEITKAFLKKQRINTTKNFKVFLNKVLFPTTVKTS